MGHKSKGNRKGSRSRKQRNKHDHFLEQALMQNGAAIQEGPNTKNWSKHDLKRIFPLTPNQEEMFQTWYQGSHICASGSAGTGKTFVGLYLAMTDLLSSSSPISKIIIIRSAVPTRDIGHLPGTVEEKMAQYEIPYRDILWELVGRRTTYDDMKAAKKIEFLSTSFIRGVTWNNAVILVDEGENLTIHEINSIMTRVGSNTRIIFTGDTAQTDLLSNSRHGHSGMHKFMKVIRSIRDFVTIKYTHDDIVRSDFVKKWIIAFERCE